jgi:hypothetical protein
VRTTTTSWQLDRPLWLVLLDRSEAGEATLLQAERDNGSYVLAFSSDEKARATLNFLGLGGRRQLVCVGPSLQVELLTALCQVGALGIMLDFEPERSRCAWVGTLVGQA